MNRGEVLWTGEVGMGAAMASALGGWEHLRFEITEEASPISDGGRWSCTPGLGIFYAQTDLLGNVVVLKIGCVLHLNKQVTIRWK